MRVTSIRDTSIRHSRRGFSLIELLIVIAIIMIIVGIAAPQYNKTMMNARETGAMGAIRTIHQMETQYYSQFGKYAQSLTELGPPASGAAGPAASGLISEDLAEGKKGGYLFTLQAVPLGYTLTAVPEAFGSTGRRSFYSDQTMVVRQSWTQEPATDKSPEVK